MVPKAMIRESIYYRGIFLGVSILVGVYYRACLLKGVSILTR